MEINKLKKDIVSLAKRPRWKAISLFFNTKKETERATAFVESVSHRLDCPQGDWVPADLRDKNGSWQVTKDGYPVAGQVLTHETHIGSHSPVLPIILGTVWTSLYASLVLARLEHYSAIPLVMAPSLYMLHRNFNGIVQFKTVLAMIVVAGLSASAGIASTFLSYVGMGSAGESVKNFINFLPVIAPFAWYLGTVKARARKLAFYGNKYSGSILNAPKSKRNETRWSQALKAKVEQEAGVPFITFGTATGLMSFQGDVYAPDKGLPFGLSYVDLSKHFIVCGSTRSGKTTAMLRPLIAHISKSKFGMFIQDGKNSLAKETASDDIKMISTETCVHFNFISGLNPTELAGTIRETNAPKSDGDDKNAVFKDKAEIALTDVCIFRQALVNAKVVANNFVSITNLSNLYRQPVSYVKELSLLTQELKDLHDMKKSQNIHDGSFSELSFMIDETQARKSKLETENVDRLIAEKEFEINSDTGTSVQDIQNHPLMKLFFTDEKLALSLFEEGTVLNSAYKNFLAFQNEDTSTKSGAFFNIDAWLIPFTQNPKLSSWINSETSDIDIMDLFTGSKMSLSVPEQEYQLAGKMINKLIQKRIYNAFYLRGEDYEKKGQVKVFLITDECQDVYGKATVDAAAWLAGLGGVLVGATQNFESLKSSLGEFGAKKLWDSFRNFATFKSSHETYQVISQKVGEGKIWTEAAQNDTIAFSTTAKLQMSNAIFDINNPNRTAMMWSGIDDELIGATTGLAKEYVNSSPLGNLSGKGNEQGSNKNQSNGTYGNMGIASLRLSEKSAPLLNDIVIDALNTPFTCFISVERGDVVRRDVIKTNPLTSDFKDLNSVIKKNNDELMKKLNIKE